MAVNKRHHAKIEEGFKEIFGTETKKEGKPYADGAYEGLKTIVKDPLNEHQIIALAELAKEVSVSMIMKRSGTGIVICFW